MKVTIRPRIRDGTLTDVVIQSDNPPTTQAAMAILERLNKQLEDPGLFSSAAEGRVP